MEQFLVNALLGGTCVALICGPLGSLVVWQRMSYFGATLSHAALLGVPLGLLFQIELSLAILVISLIAAIVIYSLSGSRGLSNDTLLGITAHGSLALGLLIIATIPNVRVDIFSYLFGDILSISQRDLIYIFVGGIIISIALRLIWNPLLSLIVQAEIARVEGINEHRIRLIFLLALSLMIAISMQIIGVLLIVSLLIIPAATVRPFSNSPKTMVVLAALIGVIAVWGGLWMSFSWDTPSGPSIVVVASVLFVLAQLFVILNRPR